MKRINTFLISVIALAAINLSAQTVNVTDPVAGAVQTSATPTATGTSGNWLVNLWNDGRAFLTDNTNIFNAGSVQAELGPVLNLSDMSWGANLEISFPVAQQASVGFDLFYYKNQLYDGTFNTTIGKTWTLPVVGPVYTYGEVGIGTDLQDPTEVINVEWAGVKWKLVLKSWTASSLSLTADAAAGHVSGVVGTIARGLVGLEYDY